MRQQPNLTINGLMIPIAAGGEIEQSYGEIGGSTGLRLGAGAFIRQTVWRRLATVLQANGWMPAGFAGIDWHSPITLGCVGSRAVQSATASITLPAARRSDAAPFAFAVMPDGRIAATPVSVNADLATVTPVTGAVSYQVHFYPLLVVDAGGGPRERYDAAGAVAGWTMEAEEV